jgi:hypothetical protein
MPSHLDTARSGRNALKVRIERNAGISSAPAHTAPKLIIESCGATQTLYTCPKPIKLVCFSKETKTNKFRFLRN